MTRARLGASARGVARVPPAAPTPAHAYYQEVAEDGVVFPQEDILNFINYFILTDTAGVSTNVNLDIPAIIAALYYQTVQRDGVSVTQRPRLNLIHPGFTVADNAGNQSTDVSFDASIAAIVYVNTAFAGSPSTGTQIAPFATTPLALTYVAAQAATSWIVECQQQVYTGNITIPAKASGVILRDSVTVGDVTINNTGRLYLENGAVIGNVAGTTTSGTMLLVLTGGRSLISGSVNMSGGAGNSQLFVDGGSALGVDGGFPISSIGGAVTVTSSVNASQVLFGSTISAQVGDYLNCRFTGAHTYSGTSCTFWSCHTMPPSITFSGSAGIVYLDNASYYWFQQAGTTVTNGSVVLMSPTIAMPGTTLMPGSGEVLAGAANKPTLTQRDGTNFPVAFFAYDDTNNTAGFWHAYGVNYRGGSVIVTIQWNSESATSGNVVWGVSLAAVTPGDAGSYEAKAFAAEVTATSACLATTAKRLTSVAITISGASLDSLAQNDNVTIQIRRLGADGSDTMAGNANFELAQIAW